MGRYYANVRASQTTTASRKTMAAPEATTATGAKTNNVDDDDALFDGKQEIRNICKNFQPTFNVYYKRNADHME